MAANDHPLFISVACWVSSELMLLTLLSPYCPVKWFWWRKAQLTQLTVEWQLAGIGEAGFLIVLLLCELLKSSSATPSLPPAPSTPKCPSSFWEGKDGSGDQGQWPSCTGDRLTRLPRSSFLSQPKEDLLLTVFEGLVEMKLL